jgi:PAS domain S-box-containing protein
MDDKITFWNRSAAEHYGWGSEEAIGAVAHDLLRTEFPKPLAEIKTALKADGCWEGELKHRTRRGEVVIVASRLTMLSDAVGEPEAILESDEDITERRRVEGTLMDLRGELRAQAQGRLAELDGANLAFVESQERFQQMAENIHDVFWLTNPSRTEVIYVNRAYEQIWGRTRQSLYEKPWSWFEAVHPDHRNSVRECLLKPIPVQGYEQIYRVVRPDHSVRWVLDRAFPVRDGAGRFYRVVGIVRDITHHRELEQEILAISEREQRRIGQDLHDDLCQQLGGIEYLSEALRNQLKNQPESEKAGEIAQLIRAAIEHTRLLARGLAPFDLGNEGLMKNLQLLAARTQELGQIKCAFECPQPVAVQDPTLAIYLYRIAQEAINNCLKHAKAKEVLIRLTSVQEGLALRVADNGIGFSECENEFAGMGLRIMQYRADTIGGRLAIQSSPQGGTSIECTVPLNSRDTEAGK